MPLTYEDFNISDGGTSIIRIKGEGSRLNLKVMPSKISSLNEGDAFLIDFGYQLQQWNGKFANEEEISFARELAAKVLKDRRKARNMCRYSEVFSGKSAPVTLRESMFSRLSLHSHRNHNMQQNQESRKSFSTDYTGVPSWSGTVKPVTVHDHEDQDSDPGLALTGHENWEVSAENNALEEETLSSLPHEEAKLCGLVTKKLEMQTAYMGGLDSHQAKRKLKLYRVHISPAGIDFLLMNKSNWQKNGGDIYGGVIYSEYDTHLLDTGLQLFLWTGSRTKHAENEELLEMIEHAYKTKHVLPQRPWFLPLEVNKKDMIDHLL